MSGSTSGGDPYRVLDVRRDASPEALKRRWRDLAREHHPDKAGDGREREWLTMQMARINAAYDVLRDPVRRAHYDSTPHARRDRYAQPAANRTASGPPPPPPSRPVTARFDTSALFQDRNTTLDRYGTMLSGQGPVDWREYRDGPDLRASEPNGPVYRRMRAPHIRVPSLEDARSTVLGFGRFHGMTLGEVADRDPTYLDWVASTITRDRDLVQRARVIMSDLDARGVERHPRVAEA
jgi:curved DNA-binding protein CbpA